MTDDSHDYALRPSAFPWPPVLWFGSMAAAWLMQRLAPLAWPGTDDLATPPWQQLGPDGCARLLELLQEPVQLVVAGGGIPFPNPVGLPAPTA